ncbi:hypothetical protein PRUB_a3823 [Pseudoalteromonas rubra]|uniref:Uncharacterized protein n=1 Tax=Pseudoalteromonas rubra TaxID=43658 RepID=A0A8T0C8B3_9GAMM|nr:hypothetical protein PRUB_a3823 [Pseudoalteromonas rubra]
MIDSVNALSDNALSDSWRLIEHAQSVLFSFVFLIVIFILHCVLQ